MDNTLTRLNEMEIRFCINLSQNFRHKTHISRIRFCRTDLSLMAQTLLEDCPILLSEAKGSKERKYSMEIIDMHFLKRSVFNHLIKLPNLM